MPDNSRVEFTVTLKIMDKESVREHASALEDTSGSSWEDVVATAVVNPEAAPLGSGYEIVSKSVTVTDDRASVSIACNVLDTDALVAEVKQRYQACWSDSDWQPESLEEALYEILVASNGNPSPDEIGLEIHGFEAITRTPIQAAPAPGA